MIVSQTLKTASRDNAIDRLGVIGSALCAVHCFTCGFLPGLLTILGLGALFSSEAEWAFSIFTIIVASGALWAGFRKHRSRTVAALFLIGMSGLLLSRMIEEGASDHHHGHSDHHVAHSEHHAAHGEHSDSTSNEAHGAEGEYLHLLGTIIGVLSGFPIVFGHILSIRKARCCENNCLVAAEDTKSNQLGRSPI